jgi:pilin isopeptide linkage protein/uncharacterized repeat protein (TIGR01451 family)
MKSNVGIFARRTARKILSLLMVFTLLFAQTDFAPFAVLSTRAEETIQQTPAPEETEAPTVKPTEQPTERPTEQPTEAPTEAPTEQPTETPAEQPTDTPTEQPTDTPAEQPTAAPTVQPTEAPTEQPTEAPTEQPTDAPTEQPTATPAALLPIPSMAKDTGDPAFSDALTATQWAAEQTSLVTDPLDGFISVKAAIFSSQPVKTGLPFVYKLTYGTLSAPLYDNGDGNMLSAYGNYDDVEVTVKAPAGVKLIDNSGNLIANPGATGTIVINSKMTAGSGGSITFQGVMIDNGLSPDNTSYHALEVTIQSTVTVSGTKVNFSFTPTSGYNDTAVVNDSDSAWTVDKTAGSATPVITGTGDAALATFTYYIEAGKQISGSISGSSGDYNKYGTLNFVSGTAGFTLTDALPTFQKDGVTIAPQSSTITLLDGSGNPTAHTASGGASDTSLSISDYNTITLDAAYASVGTSPEATTTPFYSKYKVTVSYLLSDLTLPYGSSLENDASTFTLTNAATLNYKLSGMDAASAADNASIVWKKTTPPGNLAILKFIPFNGSDQPYDSFWKTVFPGGAQFAVYQASDWNTGSGQPNSGATAAATYSLSVNDESHTIPLRPGEYYILETSAPTGTDAGPAVHVTVVSGETVKASYANAANITLLSFKKVDQGGSALGGAVFALKQSGTTITTATSNAADGMVYLTAPAGTYDLVETSAPSGYVPMDPVSVTLVANQTNTITDVVDELATASLTITKYAVTYAGGSSYAAADKTNIKNLATPGNFTFALSWSEKDTAESASVPYSQTVTLGADGTATVSGLKRVDGAGNWIQYALAENAPGDAAFLKDGTSFNWSFDRSHPTSYSASFYNALEGQLKIKKQQIDLDGTTTYPSEKGFKLYEKDGSNYVLVTSLTTGSDGTATSAALPIDGSDGSAIQYYLVEDADPDYSVTYPSYPPTTTITVDSVSVSAWPVTLGFQKLTDLTSSLVVNRQNKGKITVVKKNASGATALAGAQFKVYLDSDATIQWNGGATYTTDASGSAVISPMDLNVPYYIKEVAPPANYLLSAAPTQNWTLTEPLESKTLTFNNDQKPLLSLSKILKNLATGSTTSPSDVSFQVYTLTDDLAKTFTAVNPAITLTTVSGAASAYLPDAGDYYLRETVFPANVIAQGQESGLYASLTKGSDNNYYYGPISASRNSTSSITLYNYLNRGKIEITKQDVKTSTKLANAKFTISATTADAPTGDILKNSLGFGQVGDTYTYTTGNTNASGFVSLEGMPIYDSTGATLVYTVKESTAPSGYLLNQTAQTATFTTTADRVFEMTFNDTPQVTLNATKMAVNKYDSKGHEVQLALSGAAFDVYQVTTSGSDHTLLYVASTTSTAAGLVSFGGLDGLASYVIIERTSPEGYDLPDGKSSYTAAGSLAGTYSSGDYSTLLSTYYNTGMHDFSGSTATSYAFTSKLINYVPYAQFKLTKTDVDTGVTLDHAKYQLYSTNVSAGTMSYDQLIATGTLENYTYETGTESGVTGTFLTNAETYGKVYWLVEVQAPAGYILPDADARVVGPLTPEGTGWGTYYVKNGLTSVAATNKSQSGGSGDAPRYLQIEINKILKDSTGTTTLCNLPGAAFEIWLADGTGQPVTGAKIATMTTGLDMGSAADPSSVAGRAISQSFDMAALYASYGSYVTRSGSAGAYDYSAQFVLKEVSYPKDTTPVKTQWVLTASTAGASYTVNSTYTGANSIPDLQMAKVAVRFRKMGYSVASPATQTPLQGVVIGVYTTSALTTLVTSGTTDQYGYVSFQLNPSTTYYAAEITAIAGYEKPTTNLFSFTTGSYGSTMADIPVTDPAYRKLTITKHDADGNPVSNTVFKILKSTGGQITDANGAAISPDTVTTGADGTAFINLPAGTYRVDEVSVNSVALTATEISNYRLANPGYNSVALTAAGQADFTMTVNNPAKAALTVTKVDDADAPVASVSFAVQFKAFGSLGESAPVYTDSGFSSTGDWLSFAVSATWTTDASGLIAKTGLIPGWYKLTETVPAGYVSTGVTPIVVKVTAKGLGQADSAVVQQRVTNTRKGYVTLTKSFLDPVAAWPSTVTFKVWKNAALTVAANPATVTLATTARTASNTFALDPGTYYIQEPSGSWYARYSVNGGEESWLDPSIPITVTSANTTLNAVAVNVSNNLTTATVSLKKMDDASPANPIQGAVFALYYLDDSSNRVYLTPQATTGTDGTATLTVTLPRARVLLDKTAYYLEEMSAPPQCELVAPIPLTLTPGASLDWTQQDHENLLITDKTALFINLTKYGKTRVHLTDPATQVLPGATFALYKVDTAQMTGTLAATATTGADGKLLMGNLPKLTGNEKYYIRESVTPSTHVTGSLELYNGGTKLSVESVSVGGSPLSLYPVAQAEDNVSLTGYNTPKGAVAVLKYNYIDPKNASAVPLNAKFEIRDAQNALAGTIYSSAHLSWHPASLDGGSVTYSSGSYYVGGNGAYYSSAVLQGLVPGQYTITETGAATGFLLPPGTGASDPWHTFATVTVGDDGETAVAYIANVPQTSIVPAVQKSVYAINGNTATTQIAASLQKGAQRVTFQIANIASTASKPFLLPIEKLIVKDNTLSFSGLNASGATVSAQVTHSVTQVTVGKASYLETTVAPVPTGEAAKVTASVYGMAGSTPTLLGAYDITGSARTVTFPSDTYDGFQVEYTASSGGMLQPGFAVDPVLVEMSFVQADGAAVVPARSIQNTVNAKLTYTLGTQGYDSGWKDSTAAVVVVPDEALPKATLSKSAVKLQVVDGVRTVVTGSADITVQPGDWLRYTVTLTNPSSQPMPNPVIVDKLPQMLGVDLANVSVSAPSGLTASPTASYTDGSGIVYVYANLTGSLAAGASVTMTIDGTVRLNSVVTGLTSLDNVAYAASTSRILKNVLNPYGTPFTDASGVLPANLLDGSLLGGAAGENYQAISASKSVALMQSSSLSVYKLVAADASGLGNYVSSDEYAIASIKDGTGSKGKIKYQIVVVNGGASAASSVRMVDRLPTLTSDYGMNGQLRGSKWPVTYGGGVSAVDGTGKSVSFSLYSTSSTLTRNALVTAITSGPSGWSSGASSSSKAILLDFGSYSLPVGGKIIITYEAWAPDTSVDASTLSGYYFEASVNDAAAAADGNPVYSGPAKVVLMPDTVSAGDRVWIDKNVNGAQDDGEPSYAGGGITVSLLKYFNNDSSASVAASTSVDTSGIYQFDGLTPADIKSGVTAAEAYDVSGNIINSKLKGSGRVSYQFKVAGIPEGYVVVTPFAQNGGVAPNYASGSGRETDSNFAKSGEAYLSEKFYLLPGQNNMTIDLGLCRVRDLEIDKRGDDGVSLSGVQLTVYGPYTDQEVTTGIALSDAKKVTTLTTGTTGKATFASTSSLYLNYYSNYVVVETGPAAHYDAKALQVSGGSPAASTACTVTGSGIDGANYFVLPAKTGEEARKDTVTVTNPYVASGSVILSGSKTLTGRTLGADEFSFKLTDVTDAEHPVDVNTTTNDASGAFAFPALTYTQADFGKTFTYHVVEVPGSVANHTFDSTVYTVTVSASDSGLQDGNVITTQQITYINATHPSATPTESIGFANSYAANTSVPVSGSKALTGRAIESGEFAFELYQVTEGQPQLKQTVYNAADGTFAFSPLAYDQDDIGNTYTYTVSEDPASGPHGSLPNHTYDPAEYTITVTVGYDAETGDLTTDVQTDAAGETYAAGNEELAFSNDYAATASVPVSGTKALAGRRIVAGEFAFKLYQMVGSEPKQKIVSGPQLVQTVYNAADGTFAFDSLQYTQADIGNTYTYTVSEDPASGPNGSLPNHTYDQTVYTITVAVGYDAETGDLTTFVTTKTAGETYAAGNEDLAFSNDYAATTSVPIGGSKTLTGRALETGEFAFKLYQINTRPKEKTINGIPQLVQTVYNLADGTFAFDPLQYTQADIGKTYAYTVSEAPAAGPHGSLPNHTYDQAVYDITVTVGYSAATGTLTTFVTTKTSGQTYEAGNEGLAFANSYAATTSVPVSGTKSLEGRVMTAGEFSFKLAQMVDGHPQLKQTVTNAVSGAYAFQALQYTQADIGNTYTYRVTEVPGGVGGFTYDKTLYTVTVAVGYGADTGSLTTSVKTYKGSSNTPQAYNAQNLDFANQYNATGSYTPTGTKQLTGRALLNGMFRFEVWEDGVTAAPVSTGVSSADGTITFTPIQYQKNASRDDTGTHHYTIKEITGNSQGIDNTGVIYDTATFPLTIVVDDVAGNGQLGIAPNYPDDSPLFQNATEKVDIAGRKIWSDQSNLYLKRPADVTVYLLADGAVKDQAVLSGAGDEWSYSFTGLPRYDYSDPYNVQEIQYTVDESPVTGYYKAIGAPAASTGENGRRLLTSDITNTLRLFTVSKRTDGGARLSGAALALYSVNAGIRTLVETWRTSGGSDHVVSGLEPGSYLLVETTVPAGYVKAADIAIAMAEDGAVTSTALTGGVIRMVDELIPTADVTGTKTWVDLGNAGNLRPGSIQITLYADGTVVNAQPAWTQNGDVWTYTYAGLNIYRSGNSGSRIVYTVKETPVPGYEALYDGLNITNQLADIEVKYVELSGTKTWVDDNDAAGVRPDSITVYLLRNGEVIASKVVTADDDWAYSFANLPDSDGHATAYTYAINEKPVPSYARSLNGNNLINTYVPTSPQEDPVPTPKPTYTPETWEEMVTFLDAGVPLYGGLLKTGDETPLYPYVFGGLGLFGLILVWVDRRRRKGKKK